MPMRIDATRALARSRNYQMEELDEYRYLAGEVSELESMVSAVIISAADSGENSTIFNLSLENSNDTQENLMKARMLCESLHNDGFTTSIFYDDFEADYPTGHRVVIMWS